MRSPARLLVAFTTLLLSLALGLSAYAAVPKAHRAAHGATTTRESAPTTDTLSAATLAAPASAGASDSPDSSATPSYFVSASGSDSGTGSSSSPWRTVQHAVDTAAAGTTIQVGKGTFAPFTVRRSVNVTGSGAQTVIAWQAGYANVITVHAQGVTISDMSVSGCTPTQVPGNGYEWGGSASVAVTFGGRGSTLDSLTITGQPNRTSEGLSFGCYGIVLRQTQGVTVSNNDISKSGYGVFVFQNGANTVIRGNTIHDNNLMVRNTVAKYDDFGGVGVGVTSASSTADAGVRIANNTLYDNWAPSHDYGTDGGTFEIYGSSYVTFNGNTAWNNDNILETGAGSKGSCGHLTFTNNSLTGASGSSPQDDASGMYLRCVHDSVFSNNTFTDVHNGMFNLMPRGSHPDDADNLSITSNTITQHGAPVYCFGFNPHGHNLDISSNTYKITGAFAKSASGTYLKTQSNFAAATGMAG